MVRGSLVLTVLVVCSSARANATGFTDYGFDILASTDTRFEIDGSLRLRLMALNNLDLDRGATPSGELFYPVPLADPLGQQLYGADLRFRTDLAFYAPGGAVAVKARIDVLDNLPLAGSADGIPGGSVTQIPPTAAFRVRRAYGELVTPLGYLAAGRIGNHWGLGILANDGDCFDCDRGDSSDRIALVVPLVDHLVALAYDLSAAGRLEARNDSTRFIDVEPSAQVRTLSAAFLRYATPSARRRRLAAGRWSVDYGAYLAYRFQDNDIPATYVPVAVPVAVDRAQIMYRGFDAVLADVWFRLEHPLMRFEVESVFAHATVDQASLVPGALLREGVRSDQFAVAFESLFGKEGSVIRGGLDAGFASGDPAPGFGATDSLTRTSRPQAGDLDGPQGGFAGDTRVDNFRFHPDYRIDRILFREIIGTVTGAYYLRPHGRLRLASLSGADIEMVGAGILSFAHYASSTPGGRAPLGAEFDLTLGYHSEDGFAAMLVYAVLFPLSGLHNVAAGLNARPAQVVHLGLAYGF